MFQGRLLGKDSFCNTAKELHPDNNLQAKKHLGPKLIEKAAEMGIEIRPVHVGRSLEEQGPFDILLHKVRQKGEHARLNSRSYIC